MADADGSSLDAPTAQIARVQPARITADTNALPAWARWNGSGPRYTVGVEEEAMLLDAQNLQLRQCADAVHSRLSGATYEHTGL